MKKSTCSLLILTICMGAAVLAAPPTTREFTQKEFDFLRQEADRVSKLNNNVLEREQYMAFMVFGDALVQRQLNRLALQNYEKGLCLDSWNYEYQYRAALLEQHLGRVEDADARLVYVLKKCKDPAILEKAAEAKAKHNVAVVEPTPRPPRPKQKIQLVFFDDVDDNVIEDIRSKVEKEFNINAEILEKGLKPNPEQSRNRRTAFLDHYVNTFIKDHSEDAYLKALAQLDVPPDKSYTLEAKQKFAELQYKQSPYGEALWQNVLMTYNDQFDAYILLTQLREKYLNNFDQSKSFGIVGITGADICSKESNYLFSLGSRPIALMSFNRFLRDDAPSPVKQHRIDVQVNSSVCQVMGVLMCDFPGCVTTYPHSVEEHDRKDSYLCPKCRKKLDAFLYK